MGKRTVRGALRRARQRREWFGFLLGVITLAILGAINVVLGIGAALVGSFVAAPFVCALVARAPATLLVGTLALALAAATEAWQAEFGTAQSWIALAIIGVGTLFAAASAWNRQRSRLGRERLRILDTVATIADGSRPLDRTLDTVTELIVPSVADICMIDAIHPGGVTRAAVRAWGHPRARVVEERFRTRPPSLPKWLASGERHWRHIPRWRPRVSEEELRRMARSEADFEFLSSLRLRSMLVVPIAARDRNLGALTLLSAWSHRDYTEDDVRFAQIAARRIGLALDNAGLFSDLESVERRMDTVMSILDEAVIIHSRAGELVFANPAAASTMGCDSPEELATTSIEKIGERLVVRDESGRPLEPQALAGGRAITGKEGSLVLRVTDRESRRESWYRRRSQSIQGPDGPLYSVTVIDDITDVKRAEFAQALLARTGELLASSIDYSRTLEDVARLAVPELADWCSVNVPTAGGEIEALAVAHVNEERARWASELRKRYPVRMDDDGQVLAEVIRTGRAQLLEVDDELLRAAAQDEEHLRLLRSMGLGSVILAPLTAGGSVVGAVMFGNESDSRSFDARDLGIAVELGRRAGLAIENARIAGERARVAEVLERELLPPDLPEMEGWEVATMYRAAGETNEVGGDFYEAFAVGDAWAVMLGDVSGHGALAASLTAVARHTIRTATTLAADPTVGLRVLDERLRERDAVALCSIAVLLLPRGNRDQEVEARVWLAGHPRPFVLHEGTPREVGTPGPLVGIGEVPAWEFERVTLYPGDQLVLYTDGVIEARRPDGDRFGVERLQQRLSSCEEPSTAVARVESAVAHFSPGQPEDDATLVAIRRAIAPATSPGNPTEAATGSAGLVSDGSSG